LDEIQHYLFLNDVSDKVVKSIIKNIMDSVRILEHNPFAGRVVQDYVDKYADKSVRELISGNYRIIYVIKDNLINVVKVHHQARLLNDILTIKDYE
jgi:mRNA-degrading endonuclease RelE of RelBE toxin-antitoxin system